ncbi:Blp family class II bacteriocin [Streptococcus macacae]|uniref:Bacteriocin class II with double-glycine leader peptide n=1 Tax=Streptococcus macacae NCTC 11558 TaxID=764298 RepID=G5JUX8_9STRE|nr:Blp family class II bacteriocin [Streptococcus macacae]EHJ52630.1 bacteriocin class II with double-glycine leader peptide [Streptococcus macacae NCTC 11558]SUN79276.1 Bacteriocin class II with double-glycine leader peptide [Streptococcus macacae NCTC 11558]
MKNINQKFTELKNIELSSITGGDRRLGNAVISAAMGAVEGAKACSLGGPWVVAACAAGAGAYSGYWGYVIGG